MPTAQERAAIEQLCEVHVVVKSRWRSVVDVALWGLVARQPVQLTYFHSSRLRHIIKRIHFTREFDLAHIFYLRALPFVEGLSIPRVLDVCDAQTLAVSHRRAHANFWLRPVLDLELRRVRVLEQVLGGPREHLIVVSEKDRACFRAGAASVIPLGVDLPTVSGISKSTTPLVVFSGNMSYYANVQAGLWFIEKCWLRIVREIPAARFRIIGRDPSPKLLKYHGDHGVEVRGQVGVMADELASAWVAVAPMTVSGAMHNKVLEAMAASVPVVASRTAAEKFGASSRDGLFSCGDAEEFAAQVQELLLFQPERAAALGAAARSFVSGRFSWDAATRSIEAIYDSLVVDSLRP
jgi:glycosyltransferase involved in cell wall biosynthesis